MDEFIEAYDRLADAIFRHCYFRVFDREKAKDLMQDTFVKTWKYISNGGQILQMKPFLYKVANNLIIDNSRRHTEQSLDKMADDGFDPVSTDFENLNRGLEVGEIEKIISGLDPEHRQVLVMRHIDGFSIREIANIIGDTENTVSVRVHRAIQKVRKITQEQPK